MSTARFDSPGSRHHIDDGGCAIDVHSLNKHLGDKHVVKDLFMQAAYGEIFDFLGPDGSDKATSTRMIYELPMPDSGSGSCLGCDILKQSAQIKRRVGCMTQRFSYRDDLSIRENLDFIACLCKMPNRCEAADHMPEHLGPASCVKQLVGSLSGGWKQRLVLAACIFYKPEPLLLGEPTAGVDPRARRNFREELHQLAAESILVLVSTHYMDEAERCHKFVYIAYGELLAQDTVDEVITTRYLSTWSVSSDDLVELGRKLEGQLGVDQTVAFSSVLHVTGADVQTLEGTLRKPAGESGIRAEPIDTDLEDMLIYTMRRPFDNYGTQP